MFADVIQKSGQESRDRMLRREHKRISDLADYLAQVMNLDREVVFNHIIQFDMLD